MSISYSPIANPAANLKPWEGNGGTYTVDNPEDNAAVVDYLQAGGANLAGSNADAAAMTNAQTGVATDIFQKSFFDRGNTYGYDSAAQMAQAYVNTDSQTQLTPSPAGGGINITPMLIIGGAVILALLISKKKGK